MSLILLVGAAHAGTVVWIDGAEDPAITGTHTPIDADALIQREPWSPDDTRALDALRAELAAVAPLANAFDGELEILDRLNQSIAAVTAIRSDADRDLLYRALLFQGFAAQRYYQETLATDAAAEDWRIRIGAHVEVRAWVDAVALHPDREPTQEEVSEAPELEALLATRERLRAAPGIRVAVAGMPRGGRLMINGTVAAGALAELLPGYHRLMVLGSDGEIRARRTLRLQPELPSFTFVMPSEERDLKRLGREIPIDQPTAFDLPGDLGRSLKSWETPIYLAFSQQGGTLLYQVEGGRASRVQTSTVAPEGAPPSTPLDLPTRTHRLSVDGSLRLGAAWIHDPRWFDLNASAPHAYATVNAVAPTVGAAVELRRALLVVGAGADLFVPAGAWHSLPVGDTRTRLRLHPHLAVGLPCVQLTAGAMLPWRLALGARVSVPLVEGTSACGSWTQGIGLPATRNEGPVFRPGSSHTAFVGLCSAITPR